MSTRPAARRSVPAGPRVVGPVASDAPRPACRAVRAGAALVAAGVGRGDLRRRLLLGLRVREAAGARRAVHRRRGGRGGPRPDPRRQPIPASTRGRSRPPSASSARSRGRASRSSCPTPSRSPSTSASRSSCGRSATSATSSTRPAPSSRSSGDKPPADAAALHVLEDRRAASAAFAVGRTLDPVDLDAATRLALARARPTSAARPSSWPSASPTRTGSSSAPRPAGWTAVFGFYTPSLRTPALIPGQVRLLRSLLVGREEHGRAGHPRRPTPTGRTSREPSAEADASPKPSAAP